MSRLPGQPVNAGIVALGLPLVAERTIHRLQDDVIIWVLGRAVRVATDADIGPMDGRRQLRLVHEKRDDFPGGVGLYQRVIAVAIKAIRIAQRIGPQ